MAQSIQKADWHKRRLIADSAHELCKPISLICARIEMMKEEIYPINSESLSYLSAESKRLAKLVKELGHLSDLVQRWNSGKITDTSHTRAESGGAGLGLVISREIIRLHDGKIEIQDAEKLGGAACILSLRSFAFLAGMAVGIWQLA